MPIPDGEPVVPRVSLRQSTADRIRAAIYDGTFQAGELLIDQELQEWLGVSRSPVREALHELERVGLVEMAPQRYTRVAQPREDDRTAVLQALGALVSGVVRVTVPTLRPGPRAELIAFVEHTMTTVDARDADGHGRSVWGLVDRFLTHCENPVLVATAKDAIGALVYRLSVTRNVDTTEWSNLEVGYPHLRAAIAAGDAVGAELAVEHIFRLQTPLADDEDPGNTRAH